MLRFETLALRMGAERKNIATNFAAGVGNCECAGNELMQDNHYVITRGEEPKAYSDRTAQSVALTIPRSRSASRSGRVIQ